MAYIGGRRNPAVARDAPQTPVPSLLPGAMDVVSLLHRNGPVTDIVFGLSSRRHRVSFPGRTYLDYSA